MPSIFPSIRAISKDSALFINSVQFSCSVLSISLRPHGLYSPWNSPGQNTGIGSLSLLQGIFLTQQLNPGLPHCRWILYQLSHKGSPRILEWVAIPSPADLPDPGIKPGSPALQADSLPSEPPEKPNNIGGGSLSLLQGIFLTQESNQDLLHCWQILYQLSYQGSPNPLNSQTPGFPNKVAIPCLSTSSPNYWPVV